MSYTMPHAKGSKRIEQTLSTLVSFNGSEEMTILDDEEILQDYEHEVATQGIVDHLEVHDIPQEPLLGKGVFLCPEDEPIEKNEFVAIYSGEYRLLTDEDAFDGSYTFEVLSLNMKKKKTREKLFAIGLTFDDSVDEVCLYVDALKKGNYARFINNSKNPNVEAIIELVRGRPEVVYRACRKIYPGEQLLVDYTDSYWEPMGITPLPIESDTFMLSKTGEIVSGSEYYMSKKIRDKLKKMCSIHSSAEVGKPLPITPHSKKKVAEFEKILYKEHIDPRLFIARENGKEILRLRPGKKVKKGSILGVYSENNFFHFAARSSKPSLNVKSFFDSRNNRVYNIVYTNFLLTDSQQITLPHSL